MLRRWLNRPKKVVKEPDHRFLRHLCLAYQKLPDDPFFEEMDPFIKLWLYEGWVHEVELGLENARAQAILTGSFSNPEAAHKMIKLENPDFSVSEEDFEKTLEIIKTDAEQIKEHAKKSHRRKRREVLK